jgi:serine/threonine protein phosphatase PrpC
MKFTYEKESKVGFKRTNNEDAIGIFNVDGGLLTIVCDGLGGNNAGEIASSLSVEIIYKSFKDSTEQDYLKRIKDSIEAANKSIKEESAKQDSFDGMATTAEILFIKEKTAYWGHVGDSRIYNLKNGKLKQLTKDHSLIQKLIDDGYLTLNQAETHPNKNIIMRALGDSDSIEIDLSKLKLDSSDHNKFLVCTDGVTNVINHDELEKMLRNKDSGTISKNLTSIIEKRGAPDNFSFVILESFEN